MDRTHTVVTVRSPGEILAALPYTIGFHPDQSLVLVSCRGPRRRVEFTMRVDLPEASAEQPFADDIARRADRAGADGVLIVCYSDEPDGAALPRRELVDRLLDRCDGLGIVVLDALLVRAGRWWSYVCAAACCPPSGTPLPDGLTGTASEIAAVAVAAGTSVLADRDCLTASIAPGDDPVALAAMTRALDRTAERMVADGTAAPVAGRAAAAGESAQADTVALVRSALVSRDRGRCDLGADLAARVIFGLHDKRARDEVMTIPLDADPAACLALFTDLARRAPDHDAAPVCTVVAAAAYLAGDGALANVALDRALTCRPGYEMALLLRGMLDAQVRPGRLREVLRGVQAELAAPRTE